MKTVKEVHGPFQFGFHIGGTDGDGISHEIPAGAELAYGPAGEDGLPDHEYLVYEIAKHGERIEPLSADDILALIRTKRDSGHTPECILETLEVWLLEVSVNGGVVREQ